MQFVRYVKCFRGLCLYSFIDVLNAIEFTVLFSFKDDLESLRHSSARDLAAIASELARSEEERRHLNDLVAVLRQRSESSSESTENNQLVAERKILEQRLEEAHLHLADIKTSWCEKISSLETQVCD